MVVIWGRSSEIYASQIPWALLGIYFFQQPLEMN